MIDFLAALAPGERRLLEAAATPRTYARGVVLFHRGDDPGPVLVLLEGQVKLTVPSASGRDVVLGFRGPRELIGDLAALDLEPRSATATAIEPVRALGLPGREFARLTRAHHGIALALLRVTAARLREADARRLELATEDVLGRVARRLLELAERFGVEGELGMVETRPRRLVIRDPVALGRLVR